MENQFKTALAWVTAKASEAYKYSLLIVAFGSTLVIYQWVISKGIELGLPWYAYGPAALIAANVWYRAIEHTLKVIAPFTAMYLLTDKATSNQLGKLFKWSGRMSLAATLVLSIATISLSLLINPEIAETLTKEKDSSIEIESSAKATSSYDRDVDLLRDELQSAKDADNRTMVEAKEKAAQLIKDAELSKGAQMYRLHKQGNGWATGQLKSAINRAKSKGERLINSVTPTAPDAALALRNYIATRSASRDTINQATTMLVSGRHDEYINTVSRRNYQLLAIVIIAFVVAMISCFLMVIGRMERDEEIIDDESPGIGKVAKDALTSLNKRIAKRMADKWDVNFSGAAPSGRKLALATIAHPVSNQQQTAHKPVLKPVSPAVLPTKAVAPKQAVKSAANPSDTVTVTFRKTDRSVLVKIDGKTYSAVQAQDKVRKFYVRSKTAKTEKGRKDNQAKYNSAKTAMLEHFSFNERAKSVSIKQR